MSVLDISIVLYQQVPSSVGDCLRSLADQSPIPRCVRVRGNSLSNESICILDQLGHHHLPVLYDGSIENLGFATGHNRNLAVSFGSGADYVLILNPDVRLVGNASVTLTESADRLAGMALVGPLLVRWNDSDRSTKAREIDSAGIRWTRDGRHFDDEPLSRLESNRGGWTSAGYRALHFWSADEHTSGSWTSQASSSMKPFWRIVKTQNSVFARAG